MGKTVRFLMVLTYNILHFFCFTFTGCFNPLIAWQRLTPNLVMHYFKVIIQFWLFHGKPDVRQKLVITFAPPYDDVLQTTGSRTKFYRIQTHTDGRLIALAQHNRHGAAWQRY